jgi:hypothetical protein
VFDNIHLNAAMITLHYSPKWLEYGFISEQFLLLQLSEYEKSDDKNLEHYRYRGFQAVLESHSIFTDNFISQYIELALLDEDRVMGKAALADLIKQPGLSLQQIQQLRTQPAFAETWLQKIFERISLMRELDANPVSDEVFSRLLRSRDTEIHRHLLALSSVSRDRLKQLETEGATRAIRNQARNKLRSVR